MKNIRTRYLLIVIFISLIVSIISGIATYNQLRNLLNNNDKNYANPTFDEDKKYAHNINYLNAVSSYNSKKIKLAIDELTEELNKYPEHAQAYFLLGKIYEQTNFKAGKYYSKMITNYEKYIQLKPKGKRVNYAKLRIAQHYVQIGLMQQNVELLNKAEAYLLSLDKSDSAVGMALGAIYLNEKKYDNAIAVFEKSINLNIVDLKIKYNSLGLAYIKKGSYAKAQTVLEIAVKIEPNDKYAHNNLGFVYVQQGDLSKAKTHFSKAVTLDPSYKNAIDNLKWTESRIRYDSKAVH